MNILELECRKIYRIKLDNTNWAGISKDLFGNNIGWLKPGVLFMVTGSVICHSQRYSVSWYGETPEIMPHVPVILCNEEMVGYVYINRFEDCFEEVNE